MSIVDTGRFWEILVIPVLQILWNTGITSIADTGRFWKILVIPVLQILENSGKYWLYQYCRYWKIRYEVAECTFILGFFSTQIFQILHITFVFRFSFPRASLCPVHSLSKTPVNRHRNVYVKLTPQSGQPLKTIRIFWSHRWTVYRSFSLYIIYILKMCILFGIGIRTNFRVVELSQFLWKIVTYCARLITPYNR